MTCNIGRVERRGSHHPGDCPHRIGAFVSLPLLGTATALFVGAVPLVTGVIFTTLEHWRDKQTMKVRSWPVLLENTCISYGST
jgi:hypothetical protein